MLCVPIKVREKVIGVMRLCSGVKRDFPEDIVTLVNAVAHQGGLAIQNASMYLKLQADKESLEKISGATGSGSNCPDKHWLEYNNPL